MEKSKAMMDGKKFLKKDSDAVSVDRTRDLQIFSLTLSQLSYPRLMLIFSNKLYLSVSSIDNSWSTARTCGRCLGHLAWVFGQAVRTARPATASAVDDGFMHAVAVGLVCRCPWDRQPVARAPTPSPPLPACPCRGVICTCSKQRRPCRGLFVARVSGVNSQSQLVSSLHDP